MVRLNAVKDLFKTKRFYEPMKNTLLLRGETVTRNQLKPLL